MSQNYVEKNRGYITSSKLKEFMRCPKCYYFKYVAEVPDPTESEKFFDKDAFLIGQALDDLLTHGEDKYAELYEVVARRSKASEKIQLTNTHARTIGALHREFMAVEHFNKCPHKKVLTWEYSGFKFRAELDDIDEAGRMIRDIKTCASVTTFDPNYYTLQMSFYQWALEELTGEKYEAMLEIVDKYKYFARSKTVIYTKSTLEGYRGRILQALEELKACEQSSLYPSAESQEILYTCPYYGYKGHGRPKDFIYM